MTSLPSLSPLLEQQLKNCGLQESFFLDAKGTLRLNENNNTKQSLTFSSFLSEGYPAPPALGVTPRRSDCRNRFTVSVSCIFCVSSQRAYYVVSLTDMFVGYLRCGGSATLSKACSSSTVPKHLWPASCAAFTFIILRELHYTGVSHFVLSIRCGEFNGYKLELRRILYHSGYCTLAFGGGCAGKYGLLFLLTFFVIAL